MISKEKFIADVTARQEALKLKKNRVRRDVGDYFNESITRMIRKKLNGK